MPKFLFSIEYHFGFYWEGRKGNGVLRGTLEINWLDYYDIRSFNCSYTVHQMYANNQECTPTALCQTHGAVRIRVTQLINRHRAFKDRHLHVLGVRSFTFLQVLFSLSLLDLMYILPFAKV